MPPKLNRPDMDRSWSNFRPVAVHYADPYHPDNIMQDMASLDEQADEMYDAINAVRSDSYSDND